MCKEAFRFHVFLFGRPCQESSLDSLVVTTLARNMVPRMLRVKTNALTIRPQGLIVRAPAVVSAVRLFVFDIHQTFLCAIACSATHTRLPHTCIRMNVSKNTCACFARLLKYSSRAHAHCAPRANHSPMVHATAHALSQRSG